MNSSTRKPMSAGRLMAVSALGLFLLGGALGAGMAFLEDTGLGLPWVVGGALVAVVAAVWATLAYWTRLDEAAREAHKAAWLWGGGAGMAVMVLAVPILPHLDLYDVFPSAAQATPADLVAAGVLACVLVQSVGYVAGWAIWWLRAR